METQDKNLQEPQEENFKKLKQHCIIIYISYALSGLLQFSAASLTIGTIILFIAYRLNVNKKKQLLAKDTIFESHLRWAKRTFWIGTGVYFPIATIIATIIVFNFTDITSSASNRDTVNIMLNIQNYMVANLTKVTALTMIPMMPVIIWWLWRCWIGYKLLQSKEAIKDVTRWL